MFEVKKIIYTHKKNTFFYAIMFFVVVNHMPKVHKVNNLDSARF